jgi:hypothetical protein
MKKLVMIISIAALTAGSAFAQNNNPKTDWEEFGLKGKVKSVATKHYEAIDKFGSISKGKEGVLAGDTLLQFNNNGNLVKRCFYYAHDGGYLNDCETLTSDNDNNKITSGSFTYGYYVTKYDNKRNLIETNHYRLEDGNLAYKEMHKYNENGNLIETNYYSSEGKLESQRIYKYDTKQNLIEEVGDNNNGIQHKLKYKYDDRGRQIEQYGYNKFETLVYKLIYEYNNRDEIVKDFKYYYDDKENEYHSEWDYVTYWHSDFIHKSFYEYTKYDNKGNWVERITYEGEAKIPMSITERTIEYYE